MRQLYENMKYSKNCMFWLCSGWHHVFL